MGGPETVNHSTASQRTVTSVISGKREGATNTQTYTADRAKQFAHSRHKRLYLRQDRFRYLYIRDVLKFED